MRIIFLISFLSALLLITCKNTTNFSQENIRIEKEEVTSIFIKRSSHDFDSIYHLDDTEKDFLINEFNNSIYKGIYKFITEFHIYVRLNSDSTRVFRVNNNLIKENNDLAFALSNSNIIKDLWRKAKKIPSSPPLPPMLKECDSVAQIAKSKYQSGAKEYITMGYVSNSDFDEFYSKYIKEKFGVTIKADCSTDIYNSCFSRAMNLEIEKEFGSNFMDSVRKEMKIKFDNR